MSLALDDLVCADPAPLAYADYAAAARDLGLGKAVAKVMAVDEVESRGRGFHPQTGRPVILYEPHVFHRLTRGAFSDSHPLISYPTWGTEPYPGSQVQRWAQLAEAVQLDAAAALKACSWGRFQIMGFNHRPAGFDDVEAFVRAMAAGEAEQLSAFVRFLKADPRYVAALAKSDWSAFARLYNGPSFAQHAYDQRLKVAHARLSLGGDRRPSGTGRPDAA